MQNRTKSTIVADAEGKGVSCLDILLTLLEAPRQHLGIPGNVLKTSEVTKPCREPEVPSQSRSHHTIATLLTQKQL